MSNLTKTRGIVIRHAPFSETSRIIQWITEDHGKLATIAKGAMRPRNSLLGQFDQFYTCELIYYGKDREGVFVTRECSALKPRVELRSNWRAATAAGYLSGLTSRVMPGHEPASELYRLLDEALDETAARGASIPLLFLFELRLLAALGLAPKLDRCATCGNIFQTGSTADFSSQRGGMICDNCARPGEGHRSGADILAILTHWQKSGGWKIARAARCSEHQIASIRRLLGEFLTFHLELNAHMRDTALDMLTAPDKRANSAC